MANSLLCGVVLMLDILIYYSPLCSEFSPARIIEPPLDTTAQAGFFIFLICKAQGNPKPNVQFRINGKIQKTEGHRKIIRTFEYGASLRQQVQMDNNNDRIECLAENHLGIDTKSASITVIDSNGEPPPGFPHILFGPIDVLGQIGKSANIRCEVSGDPPAKITWIKDSHYHLDLEDDRFQIVGSGTLRIRNVKEKDNGSYECMARNKIGTIISQSGMLQIRNSPMTPQIIDFKNTIEVSVGHGANLTCNAEGYPVPSVWWAVVIGTPNHPSSENRPLSEKKQSSSTIHLTDITESGNYTCFASNNMGTVRKNVQIIVKKKPMAPTSVTCGKIGATFATIEWFPVKSNPIVDSYTLLVKEVGNFHHLGLRQIANLFPSSLSINRENKKLTFNVTELKPFTEYEARVIAVNNNVGISDQSLPTTFKTIELPPSSAPTHLNAKVETPDSILVSWKPPVQQNGRITGYKLYYSEKNTEPIDKSYVHRTSEMSYLLTNLIPNSTYFVKVNAFNNAGDGPVSDDFPILLVPGGGKERAPTLAPVPQNLRGASLSSNSIQIMWSAPLMPEGMTLISYELKYRTDNDEKTKVSKESIDPDKTQYLIENLKPGTVYHINLAGKTVHGLGVSAQLTEKTKDENILTGIPDILVWGTNITLTSVTVCWRLQWGDKIRYSNYKINYMLIYDTVESKSSAENASNVIPDLRCCCHILDNLKPSSTYGFWVKPIPDTIDNDFNINILTLTSGKLVISTMNQDSVPGIPKGVGLTVLGSTSIKVSWTGPAKMPDQVKLYIIRFYARSDDPKFTANTEEGTMKIIVDKKKPSGLFETVINNLTPNLYYKVEVTAVSGKGEGNPYIFPMVRTNGEIPSKPRDFSISQILRIPVSRDLVYLAVHMSWNPPEQPHGKIIGYRLTISLIGPQEVVDELGSKKRYHNLTNTNYVTDKEDEIGFWKNYLFEVEALNEINFGSPIRHNQSMPESKPTAQPSKLEIQAYKNTVTLQWLPPPINYRNGKISDYKIRYFDIKDQNRTTKVLSTKSQTSIKITNLVEKTNYVFMIRAVNKEGEGPWSPGSSYYISSEFYPPPENIIIKQLNDYQIKITWDYPSKSNLITDLQSQIVGFHIVISTNKEFSEDASNNKKIVGPVTTAVMDKVYPNKYFIRVRAMIRDERSTEWSSPTSVVVLKSKNDDRNVRNLICTGQNRAIKVMWTRPEEFSEIDSFKVKVVGIRKFRGMDDSTKTESIQSRTATVQFKPNEQYSYSYLLNNLEPNTNYDVIIKIEYSSSHKYEELSKKTSCVTLMSKPSNVQYPKPIPQRKVAMHVVLRLFRTDEKYGRISHYYLVISPGANTHITPNDVNMNETLLRTHEMKTINAPFVAAQFTTALFQSKASVDFALGMKPPTSTFKDSDWIYLKTLPIKKKEKYRAFLRSCIIPEGVENRSPEQVCTSSTWSTIFSTEINREVEVFTTAVFAGIGSIILLVFICIGFACFLKRSHSKVSRPLNSTDPCLKQPLMMQPGLSGGTLPQYTNMINSGNSRHGYGDSLRTNSDLCTTTGIVTPITNHQPLSVSNPMFGQRSLELKKMSNTPAPDLVQNALSISTSTRPPIPIHRLESHINELRANDNFLFSQEYESIDPGQQFTWENSNLEINRSKNRYANVIAYDHSRILLQPIDGVVGSDYINANYIDGFKRPNAYIATQGPLSNTFGDFWRMIWDQSTSTIVMMTKLEERTRIKCDQYWPNKGTESYADGIISVTITDTKETAYYTIRTFIISANYPSNSFEFCSNKEKREVRQYQFTAWPDHGVPDNPMPLLMFLKRIRAGNPPNSGPIVVHCSAGVGRTGAFIVIDATIERIRHEMTVDIFYQVSVMRAQRNYMVQTEDQYIFVHDVVVDAVRASNTEITLQTISSHVQKLTRAECSSGSQRSTGIELEFQKLSQFKPNNARTTSANLPVNRLKNRLVNILPYEFNRICLQPIRGCEGSDYINASYIDGYHNIKAYIATQAPLLETVEDFWRMIWEHNSTIIVMLTKLREMGREKCHRYWPTERSSRFQYFVVDPMVEYNMPNFVLQEFKVTDARDGQSRTIRQFQFTEWPEQGIPYQATETFIDFIGQVHKTKEQFGQEGPITVHCSAGVGRTGVFLALSIALERLKNEGVLDLFQTVRSLRYQRANMVQSEEQYRFCYLAVQDYVNSFDNFFE